MSDDHDNEAHEVAVQKAQAYRQSFLPDAGEALRANRRLFLAGAGAAVTGAAFAGDASAELVAGDRDLSELAGAPRGVHASFTDDPTSTVTLTWFTDGLVDPGSVVVYDDEKPLENRTTGTAEQLPFIDALVHRATITGLSPGQTITYRVGGHSGFSDIFEVTTDDGSDEFRFTFVGDQGVKETALKNRDLTLDLDPDLHLVVGDVSYANGDSPVWDLYFGQQESLMATIPTMNQVGNHEFKDGAGAADYKTRHSHPDSGEVDERHCYSFRYGNVHFSGIDNSGSVLSEGRLGDVLTWVENDLARARLARARGDIEYIVTFFHHPIYTSDSKRSTNPLLQLFVEPALHRHDVDLAIVGHDHIYERSFPMVYGIPTTTVRSPYTATRVGFVQLQNGIGGKSLRRVRPEHQRSRWSAAADDESFAVTRLDVDEDFGIEAETIAADSGEAIDRFFLTPQQYEEPLEDVIETTEAELNRVTKAIETFEAEFDEFVAINDYDATFFDEFDPDELESVPGARELAKTLMSVGRAHPAVLFENAGILPDDVEIPDSFGSVRTDILEELIEESS